MPERQLVIVGNWSRSDYGVRLRHDYSHCSNIQMMDPVYDPSEINLLRSNCCFYIHPHSVGGTNPSLVEAMYLGLPIVAFDVVYNRATTEDMALFFHDVPSLCKAVCCGRKEALLLSGKMKEIADRRYRWEIISQKYSELY